MYAIAASSALFSAFVQGRTVRRGAGTRSVAGNRAAVSLGKDAGAADCGREIGATAVDGDQPACSSSRLSRRSILPRRSFIRESRSLSPNTAASPSETSGAGGFVSAPTSLEVDERSD